MSKFSLKQIVADMTLIGIETEKVPCMSYKLVHGWTKEQFENKIKNLLLAYPIKAQNSDWYPGTPTDDEEDWGFYICPVDPTQWEEEDFDMSIMFEEIFWC